MFAWLSVAAGLAGCQREPTPVIILTIDTLRPDHLSTYGYGRETDPGIAAVAADGVVFTRAFTTVPKTSPAFASMFTGLYPHRHGLRMLGQELAEPNSTLAEQLTARGFDSAGFVSSTIMLARLSQLDQGFEVWDDFLPEREPGRVNHERPAGATGARALAWLRDASAPFFLFVHFIDPHGPYRPPRGFRQRYLGGDGKVLSADEIPEFQRLPGARTLADYVGAYDGEIAYADASLRAIVDQLRRRGIYDRALLIVTSDHGESFGEDGYYFRHGKTLEESSTRIPLIIKPPGGRRPGVSKFAHEPVSLIDIVPTVMDYIAGERTVNASAYDGMSLRPILEGRADNEARIVFSQREGRGRIRQAAHGRYQSYLDPPCGMERGGSGCGSRLAGAEGAVKRGDGENVRSRRLAAALAAFDVQRRGFVREFPVRWRYRTGDEAFVESFIAKHNRRWHDRVDGDLQALRSLGYLD
jgi:arylsulfatase